METMPYLSISSSANLVVLEDGAVRSYPLNENQIWKIGRKNPESENDIELESKIVSRKHGQIQSVDGEWYYIENGSLNGTYYNGSKIKANDHGEFDAVKLSNGDILRIDSDSLDYPEERGVFFLFTTEGIGNQWKTVTLNKKEISFGRNEENDITIPLSYVSGKHMVIRRRDNEYFVMDCDSMAGTWLNGEEIHGEAKLKEKDMIAICILLSTFCAGTLGFERERHNQAAGFRTYIIVSDASALVMMTNIFVAGIGETDLVRMSASVITGLGFLGAGTILVTRNQEVRGLTTAAGLWAVAIIGTAFGAGFYAGGIICYAFIFLAMQVLRRVDLRIRKTQRVSTVYFEMEKKSTVGQIIRQVKGRGHYIWDLNLFSETQEKSGGPVCGTFTLWVNGKTTLDEEIQALEALDGVSYMTLM